MTLAATRRDPTGTSAPGRRGPIPDISALPRRAAIRFVVLGSSLLLVGCNSGSGSSTTNTTTDGDGLPYSTSSELNPTTVLTSTSGAVTVTATVPVEALAMGIVVQGTDREWKFIEHRGLFLGGGDDITGPDGAVPYALPLFDNDGDGTNESEEPVALNNEAAALHFPNDGLAVYVLSAGTYTFPVGAALSSNGSLVADTLTPYVYYKTETATVPALKLNVFVVEGASGGITSTSQAQADPEVQGAVQVLLNVYETNANVAVNVDATIEYLPNTVAGLAAPGVVANDTEMLDLWAAATTAPQTCAGSPAHDAMNIYIVAALNNLAAGVIGLASGIPGPFNRHCTAISGTIAEYQNDPTGAALGFILAHEFGHYLGLFHTSQTNGAATAIVGEDTISDTALCTNDDISLPGNIDNCPDRNNLMFPFISNQADPPITVGQGNVVKFNPGVTVP